MANNRITHDAQERNNHFQIIENVLDHTSKAKALIEVALNCNFDFISDDGVRDYFLMFGTLINSIENTIKKLN